MAPEETTVRDGGAPPPLDAVAAFVNTRAITKASPVAREDLASAGAVDDWARAHLGLDAGLDPGLDAGDPDGLAEVHAVREGLRALLARHNDAVLPGDEQAITALDAVADTVALRGSPIAEPLAPHPDSRGSPLLAALLARVVTARLSGEWERLKVCRDPHCREAYYDGSKNRSRAWCSMAVCGARAKQRAMTARRRSG